MRTKTLLLTALLGALGSVSVKAQNVYSLNAVGYINVSCPPGYNMVTCPLISSPDNTIGTVMNNASGQLTGSQVYFFPYSSGHTDTAKGVGPGFTQTTNANGWANAGTNVLAPGVACWFLNNTGSNVTFTFVGTVPTGLVTNALAPGFNLVGSVVPVSGDLVTNTISALTNYNIGDQVYVYLNPNGNNVGGNPGYTNYTSATGFAGGHGYLGQWTSDGDPSIPSVGQGFFYENNSSSATVNWVENYSVSQ